MEVTVTGMEAWRTMQRTPVAHYGVLGVPSVPMAPNSEGQSVIVRRQLNGLANPQLVYALGGGQNG